MESGVGTDTTMEEGAWKGFWKGPSSSDGGPRDGISLDDKGQDFSRTTQRGCGSWGAPGHCPRDTQGYLAITANGLLALLTSAGVEGLKAGHTVGALLPQDVLLAKERFFAMVAVKALGHFDTRCFNNLSKRRENTVPVSAPGMPYVLRHQLSCCQSLSSLAKRWLAPLCESLKLTLETVIIFNDTLKKN